MDKTTEKMIGLILDDIVYFRQKLRNNALYVGKFEKEINKKMNDEFEIIENLKEMTNINGLNISEIQEKIDFHRNKIQEYKTKKEELNILFEKENENILENMDHAILKYQKFKLI